MLEGEREKENRTRSGSKESKENKETKKMTIQQRAKSLLEYATHMSFDDARDRKLSKYVPYSYKNMVKTFMYEEPKQKRTDNNKKLKVKIEDSVLHTEGDQPIYRTRVTPIFE
jgi:hypothetical protein